VDTLLDLPEPLSGVPGPPDGGFAVRHRLGSPTELTPAFLAGIAERSPESWLRPLQVQSDPHEGRSAVGTHPDAAAAIRGTAEVPGYVGIYNLERFPEYADLTRALEAEIRAFVGPVDGGLGRINLAAFVSPPGSVVPAHPDMHHNFLLQITGTKTVWVEDEPDRREHDTRVAAYHECPAAPTAVLPPARAYELSPGHGVYIPPDGFHWVEVGDVLSVTFSVGFDTPRTRDVADARRFDRALGKRRLPVRPVAYPGRATTSARARLVRRLRADG